MPVTAVVGDSEPHLFNFWDAEYVRNPSHFEPTFNRTESYFSDFGCSPFIEMYKQTDVTFLNLYKELFVVNLVIGGAFFQVDTGDV